MILAAGKVEKGETNERFAKLCEAALSASSIRQEGV